MWITILVLFAGLAQGPARNPRESDPNAIRTGTARFQSSCAECHGIDAKGVFGPDLTTLWTAGSSDDRIFQTVRRGVPGSSMPASRLADDDIWAILAYLRTLTTTVPPAPMTGDAANGERIFGSSCGCVRGRAENERYANREMALMFPIV